MAGHGVQAVEAFGQLLQDLLGKAELVKQTNTVEPPLNRSDLGDYVDAIRSIFPKATTLESKKSTQYSVVDVAARDVFNSLLASTSIDSPSFVRLWNLLDIISILSDNEQCDPALLFWLVEELLDSQTIPGCRNVFDYLESRRERITAKRFGQKNLIILRSCNELLRRLSRAEDPAFCGRVFIFMFQGFPLGDKSSVNLRGEFHTENVTTFDKSTAQAPEPEKMELDKETTSKAPPVPSKPETAKSSPASAKADDQVTTGKGVTFSKAETPMNANELYPIFWSLQESFSQPKRLFNQTHFTSFKSGLQANMIMFKSVKPETSAHPAARAPEDGKKGTKRKRDDDDDDDLADTFNPKYLTSRDLFELEISDMSFRRHILVQVLITMEFLLSLTTKAKEKLASANLETQNKSVMFTDFTLSDEDAKWVIDTKKAAADYLRQDPFFYRMVETVLSRDKSWVRWKIENCPSIAKPAVSSQDYVAAKAAAKKLTANKRLRPTPLGSLDFKFLTESDSQMDLERLKDPKRYLVPPIKSFQAKIEIDDMDIDMANGESKKNIALESKASKSWRALRIASSSKLAAFDKIERSEKIDSIFQDDIKVDETVANGDDEVSEGDEPTFPTDRRPVAICGPSGVGKRTLIDMLTDKYGKTFSRKISHTTRPPREGEVHGQHYYFVSKEDFGVMRDGDGYLEYNNYDGNDYGTSRKAVEGIKASGKIPVMEMEMNGMQQLRELGYASRFIFMSPTDTVLEQRLQSQSSGTEDKIKARLEVAKKEIEHSKLEGSFDKVFINDDVQECFSQLEKYISEEEEDNNNSSANIAEDSRDSIEAQVEDNSGNTENTPVKADMVATDAIPPTAMEVDGKGSTLEVQESTN